MCDRGMDMLKKVQTLGQPSQGFMGWAFLFAALGFFMCINHLNLFPAPSTTSLVHKFETVINAFQNYKALQHTAISNVTGILQTPAEMQLNITLHIGKSALNETGKIVVQNTPQTVTSPKPTEIKMNTMHLTTWLHMNKANRKRPNVLFIVADDMRPDFGANYHDQSPWLEPNMVTPNLDSLASTGLLFRRAYCQFSWCNPSRSSFLTSRRPDTTMVHNNSVFFRMNNPNFKTLPQYFKENGYYTFGIGKIFHLMGLGNDYDEPTSWSRRNFRPKNVLSDGGNAWQAVKDEDRHGGLLLDELVANHAVKTLDMLAKNLQNKRQPFFLAVGMKKPHLNFQFPEKYMHFYPLDKISKPANPKASYNLPDIAWYHSSEIRGRKEYSNYTSVWSRTNPLPEWIIGDLRRAYYSCISYIDNEIGKVLKHLEETGLADNTIVSFIGDHGFHLGEHSIVGKNTAFEVANNAPMIIRIPGVTDNGMITDKLVEFVDIFPTLAELADLPNVPYCPEGNASRKVDICTEGTSLVPLFYDPTTKYWKDRVFYQYPHYTGHGRRFCMGYSMRTEQYRYTEWVHYDHQRQVSAKWEQLCAAELYDHNNDPHETNNLADNRDYTNVQKELSAKLKAGWLAALPKTIPRYVNLAKQ